MALGMVAARVEGSRPHSNLGTHPSRRGKYRVLKLLLRRLRMVSLALLNRHLLAAHMWGPRPHTLVAAPPRLRRRCQGHLVLCVEGTRLVEWPARPQPLLPVRIPLLRRDRRLVFLLRP